MKKKSFDIKDPILTTLAIPLILLFFVWLLLTTPIDYIRYKRSRYYKDTKEKYPWLYSTSYYLKFYDAVKNADLPIDFYRFKENGITGYGYFVYKDILILNDYEPCFDDEKGIWLVEIEDEYVDIKDDVYSAIDSCNELIGDTVCKRAVIMIDKDLYEEHPDVNYENIEFLPVKNHFDIEAIKTIID